MNSNRNRSAEKGDQIVDRAVRALREISVPEGPPAEVMEAVLAAGGSSATTMQQKVLKSRFKINRLAKIAASILIVAAIAAGIVWLSHSNGSATIAWADVQDRIRSISAVTYTMSEYLLSEEGQQQFMQETKVMEDPFMRIRRETIRTGLSDSTWDVIIQDNQSGKILGLDIQSRNAALYEYAEWPKSPHAQSFKDRLKDTVDKAHIELGEKTINETIAKGYRVELTSPSGDYIIDIWVNAKTAEPITMESLKTLGAKKFKSIHTDFEFDIYLDKSLFSTTPPPGYSLIKEETVQPLKPTVDDVVFVLRSCCERTNGNFPDSLRLGDLMKGIPEKEFTSVFAKPEALNRLNGTIALQTEASARYAGKGVKLGDATKAVFWYKPEGSETYKVIYGDLSIKEVTEEKLPR